MKSEILSSCCAFGAGCEEVHVLRSECPIDREVGRRQVDSFKGISEECTCIYQSNFGNGVARCEFYEGVKKVRRNKSEEYKVLCKKLQ
ncbi:hypothetical protein GCM10023310_69590 [Paenibacillus vulneris]|uniref:DUF1540 domain-containing protein n=1 Tax=Paenibacillus vulneris TaxID=1133364 RepID=A0ABW3UF78_9BACL